MNNLHSPRRGWYDSLAFLMRRSTPRDPTHLIHAGSAGCFDAARRLQQWLAARTHYRRGAVGTGFSEPGSFEEGAYTSATLRVDDGSYLIKVDSGDSEVWWGQWGATHSDVVIDVDIEQLSEREEAAYGVACRLRGQVGQQLAPDPLFEALVAGDASDDDSAGIALEAPAAAAIANGDGYLFLIQAAAPGASSVRAAGTSSRCTTGPRRSSSNAAVAVATTCAPYARTIISRSSSTNNSWRRWRTTASPAARSALPPAPSAASAPKSASTTWSSARPPSARAMKGLEICLTIWSRRPKISPWQTCCLQQHSQCPTTRAWQPARARVLIPASAAPNRGAAHGQRHDQSTRKGAPLRR